MTRPYNSILCAETAHIYVDECGSPVKMTGCQIRPIATPDGKLTPQLITPYLHGFADQHHSQPGAIYLSECTELGTIYTPDELKAITRWHINTVCGYIWTVRASPMLVLRWGFHCER